MPPRSLFFPVRLDAVANGATTREVIRWDQDAMIREISATLPEDAGRVAAHVSIAILDDSAREPLFRDENGASVAVPLSALFRADASDEDDRDLSALQLCRVVRAGERWIVEVTNAAPTPARPRLSFFLEPI